MPTPPIKLPRTPALMADRLYKLKALNSKAQAKVDAIDAERKLIEAELINLLPKDEASGAQGKLARVSLIIKDVPQVEDWDKLRKHIVKTGSWDLLQKRVSSQAVELRWDDDKQIPGVTAYSKVTVSLNKV